MMPRAAVNTFLREAYAVPSVSCLAGALLCRANRHDRRGGVAFANFMAY